MEDSIIVQISKYLIWTNATETRLNSALSLDALTLLNDFSIRRYSQWEPQF